MRFHMLPCACLGRFKCGPDPIQMRPCSNQMRPLLVPYVCLSSSASKSGFSGLLIHIRHHCHRFRPPTPLPQPRGSLRRPPLRQEHDGRTSARRHTTPQAYAGETRCTVRVLRVEQKPQVLENEVGVCLSKACSEGIAGPGGVRGNHDQAGKVGDRRGPSRRTEEVLDSP